MRPMDTLVITAVVSDPDGIDDLIGGTLMDSTAALSYGAFATAASEGAYSLSLGWSALNSTAPINAPAGTGEDRTFLAEFFDAAANRARGEISVTLACEDSEATACA